MTDNDTAGDGTTGRTTATPITLRLTPADAALLWEAAANDFPVSADRFEAVDDGDYPNRLVTLMWCASVGDALLLREYERSTGHSATVLWDLYTLQYAVSTTRRGQARRTTARPPVATRPHPRPNPDPSGGRRLPH